MKIYRVVYNSIYIDGGENKIIITTFLNKENALRYYKERLNEIKKEEEELEMDDYCVDEENTSYERYLDERSMEDSVGLWIEEDDTYDELVLQKQQDEKDRDYEK